MAKETQRLQKLAGLLKENSYGQPLILHLMLGGGSMQLVDHYYETGNPEDIALTMAGKMLREAKNIDSELQSLSNQEVAEEIGLDIVKFQNEEIYNVGIGGEIEWFIIDPDSFSYYERAIEGLHDQKQLKKLYFELWAFPQDNQVTKTLNQKLVKQPASKTLGQQALTAFSQNESR
jgi:hypothetical protein